MEPAPQLSLADAQITCHRGKPQLVDPPSCHSNERIAPPSRRRRHKPRDYLLRCEITGDVERTVDLGNIHMRVPQLIQRQAESPAARARKERIPTITSPGPQGTSFAVVSGPMTIVPRPRHQTTSLHPSGTTRNS